MARSDSSEDSIALSFKNYDKSREKITVKFHTENGKVFTQSYPVLHTVSDIKKSFVDIFGIPMEHLLVLFEDGPVKDQVRLGELCADQYGILELKILSDDSKYTVDAEKAYKNLYVPDIITVTVETAYEGSKDVVVEIENRAVDKPALGGYKDIKTGVVYLHGYSQTGPPKPKVPPEKQSHRDTQTYVTRNRKLDVEYSRATQMFNKDIYVPSISDRIVTSGHYETADERAKRLDVEGKVRTIQRYYRAWKLRKCIKELSDEYEKRVRLANEREERDRMEDAARRRRDMVSKVFPMTLADFAMLYTMIERWKKAEVARISATHCGPAKIAEFYILLDKEVEILRSLETLRHKVIEDMEIKKVLDFFKAIGNPLSWHSDYKGIRIEMDTLENQKGREYFAMYKTLCNKHLNTEERLKVYMEIKSYLNTHNCHESDQIIKLINRVCELLARGVEEKYLIGLEKQIEAMVFHHFKLAECNEGVTRYMKKIREKKMEKNLMFCPRCQQLKTIDAFSLNARSEKVKICVGCKWLDKAEEPWVDLLPYRFILKQIRNYERLHRGLSSVAFIMRDKDIHYIVTNIWHGHSALSESTDVYYLRLCRWNVAEEWSPWNCILLTADEAKEHVKVKDLNEVYEKEFVSQIFSKHALSKKKFSHLMKFDKHFAEVSKGDPKLDEHSEYYNKPINDCLF